MNKDKKRPPGQVGGRDMQIIPGRNISNQNTEIPCNLQHLRAAFLSRRHRLAPAMAAVVAPLFFGEATR